MGGIAAHRTPPGFEGVVHWYDFSDPATLWQDEGRTVPAVADEDEIVAISDKGYGGDHLYSGAATDPEVDTLTYSRTTAHFLNQSHLM